MLAAPSAWLDDSSFSHNDLGRYDWDCGRRSMVLPAAKVARRLPNQGALRRTRQVCHVLEHSCCPGRGRRIVFSAKRRLA
jgi:hypothetical protein